MDDTDRRLIALLRADARLSVAALAAKLGVSRATVANRMRKLEDEQLIVGYTLRLRPDAEPERIRAWMGVLVDGNQTRAVVAQVNFRTAQTEFFMHTEGRQLPIAELRVELDKLAKFSQNGRFFVNQRQELEVTSGMETRKFSERFQFPRIR